MHRGSEWNVNLIVLVCRFKALTSFRQHSSNVERNSIDEHMLSDRRGLSEQIVRDSRAQQHDPRSTALVR